MKLNKLGKLQRRLVDLQRQCLNDVPARTTECQHLWNKCRRIGSTILSEGAWSDKWQVACVPSGEQMQLIVQELRCEIQQVQSCARKQRLNQWKEMIAED